mmetsp:Transcript_58407/g.117283  ORF Transcript_58407/g.117283 Transcript_58407/m.117283 type:complete len:327 (+) Transcript_58407:141-1121(+)
MPHHDAEDLERQLSDQEAQMISLSWEKQKYLNEILESEKVARDLHEKAIAVARSHEMQGMRHAENAQSLVRKFSHTRPPAQASGTFGKQTSALERSERKLDIKTNLQELDGGMKSLARECNDWEHRATQAQEAARRAELKVRAVPRRYFETPSDLRKQLISVLGERTRLGAAIGRVETLGRKNADNLQLEVRRLRREISSITSELNHVRIEEQHWVSKTRQVAVTEHAMRERIVRLKAELIESYGCPDALILAAIDALATRGKDTVQIHQLGSVVRDYVSPEAVGILDLSKENLVRVVIDAGMEGSNEFGVAELRRVVDYLDKSLP